MFRPVAPPDAEDMTTELACPPPRYAVRAAYTAFAAATIGFLPLHVVWALGIPLFADEELFRPWYEDGGGGYLLVLNVLALAPAVLALALVRPWGLIFPRWVPFAGRRRVPRMLLIAPGTALTIFLLAYTLYALVLFPLQYGDPAAIFDPGTVVYGIVQFAAWIGGLAVATRSYARRTRPARPTLVSRGEPRESLACGADR
jgi:hypothetical protein